MKLVASLFFWLLFSLNTFSQGHTCKEDVFPVQSKNRKYGYINLFEEWRILPSFTKAYPFYGNTAVVLQGTKYGVISCEGNWVFKPEMDSIYAFVDKRAWALKGDKWGLLSDSGEVLHDFTFEKVVEISRFSEMAWVKENELWGVYNKQLGAFVHKPQFQTFQVLSDQCSLVRIDDKKGFLSNETPRYFIEPELQKVTQITPSTFVVKSQSGLYGLVGLEGQYLLEPIYANIEKIGKFHIKVQKDGLWAMASYKGRLITPYRYDEISSIQNARVRVKVADKYGYIDYKGNKRSEPNYLSASDFSAYRAIVEGLDHQFRVINTKGDTVSEAYDQLFYHESKYLFVGIQHDTSYIIDRNGQLMISDSFKKVFVEDTGNVIRVELFDGDFNYYDRTTRKLLLNQSVDIASSFTNYGLTKDGGNCSCLKTDGSVLFKALCDSINVHNKGDETYFVVAFDGSVSVRSQDGKELLSSLDALMILPNKHFAFQTKGAWIIVDVQGVVKFNKLKDIQNSEKWPLAVQTKKGWQLATLSGELLGETYLQIERLSKGYFKVKKEEGVGVINNRGDLVISPVYDNVLAFSEHYFLVSKGGVLGFVNQKGVVRVPFQYKSASPFIGDFSVVETDDGYSLINKRGERVNLPTLTDFSYDSLTNQVVLHEKGTSRVLILNKQGWNWGYLD